MIIHCLSFKTGLIIGLLPLASLLFWNFISEHIAFKSKVIAIAMNVATALLLAAGARLVGTAERCGPLTCGDAVTSEIKLSMNKLDDFFLAVAVFAIVLYIATNLRASKPIVSYSILGIVFPIIVASYSIVPLWSTFFRN